MQQGTTGRFTDAELEIARNTDLPDLLTSLGYQVKRVGNYYTTREMDSLRIKNRRTWFRYSENRGGDAISFVQRFCNRTFPEAVEYLLDYHGRARDIPSPLPVQPAQMKEPAHFVLPTPHGDSRRVFAYLQKRGIAPAVIRSFLEAGLLYEDAAHHNCVFVGMDAERHPVFAAMRGTYDLDGSGFRGDVAGSDKSTAFRLPCDSSVDRVHVFEAPIDLMSFCSLHRSVTSNAVALCGLHDGPLDAYLRENPHIKYIFLCLDADARGREAGERMKEKYSQQGYTVSFKSPPRGKDWNEYLQHRQKCRSQER